MIELIDAAVARAAGGAADAHAGGSSASGMESHSTGQRWRGSKALEDHDFPEMVWARPMLEDEGCDIDELPAGSEASTDDWCVLVHLLRERVTVMQVFARGKDPGTTFEDVMDDSFARKQARSPSPPAAAKRVYLDPAVAIGGGSAALALTPGRRDDLAQAAAGEQLQQALNGTLTPEAIPKPAGEGAPYPVITQHVGGALSGLDLRVYPGQTLDAQEKKLVLREDGRSLQWETSSKRTKCSTLPEWERGFCFVMWKVQSDRQHRLLVFFKEWFQLRALEYGVAQLIKFYEYLILQMVEDPSVTFERRCYSQSFEDYVREQRLQPAGSGQPWHEDWSPREEGGGSGENYPGMSTSPNAPRDASGSSTSAVIVRLRSTWSRTRRAPAPNEASGRARCKLRRKAPPGAAGWRRQAPAEAPALEPVDGEGHEPEIEEDDDVRPIASGFEFTPVEPNDGDYIGIGRGVATQVTSCAGGLVEAPGADYFPSVRCGRAGPSGGAELTWTAAMSTFAVAPASVPETGKWSVLEGASRRLRRSREGLTACTTLDFVR
ncbi:hypothetical protein CYMTET_21866 [Cymbomonas tetramitiformis]|uniref:Uncharacterized protein n=1 Tax=Cymbomonas tetramitiformis TaxID=36881 RepID=A0AAE0G1B6_9CHLO|nr:hypothetical protein CYMTET_21866 [Cymbomonas tetramitiformis]